MRRFISRSRDGMNESLQSLQQATVAGGTPDPCNFLGVNSILAQDGVPHDNHGDSDQTLSKTKVFQHVSLRLGKLGQLVDTTLNDCEFNNDGDCSNVPIGVNDRTTPWIWATLKFDVDGVLQPLMVSGNTGTLQKFPTYTLYEEDDDGVLQFVDEFSQSSVEAFAILNSDSQAIIPPTD